jgi:serine protease Do
MNMLSRRLFPLLLVPVLHAESPNLQLTNGVEIRAPILQETEDRVVVDLGHDLLTIPRRMVKNIQKSATGNGVDAPATDPIAFAEGMYESASQDPERPVQDLVKALGEAVVEIRTPTGLGSGFIIHPDGYLVTNHHVIAGEHKLTVTLFKRESGSLSKVIYRNIRIVAHDATRDLALLKIDETGQKPFAHVKINDREDVRQGQTVFAIGSPLGLDRTVSQGIVSLPSRVLDDGQVLIQTTAQINPGNSGGPLFDLHGHVIGVNNRKAMMVGIEGVGYAIPSQVVRFFLQKRDAFAFDPRNPNSGFRYLNPPDTKHTHQDEKTR